MEAPLAEREGVCLKALNSTEAAARAARGVAVTGGLDFGRSVTRSDGAPDRMRTRPEIPCNADHPRLSLFACQQFRRDLIEYPEWMAHPNGVKGVAGLTAIAAPEDFAGVIDWLERVHDDKAARQGPRLARIATARDVWTVTDRDGFVRMHGAAPEMPTDATLPSVAGIDLRLPDPAAVADRAEAAGLTGGMTGSTFVLPRAERLVGVCLRFGRCDA